MGGGGGGGGAGCSPLQTQYEKWGPFNCLAQAYSVDVITGYNFGRGRLEHM